MASFSPFGSSPLKTKLQEGHTWVFLWGDLNSVSQRVQVTIIWKTTRKKTV